jgi:hypothetical protein
MSCFFIGQKFRKKVTPTLAGVSSCFPRKKFLVFGLQIFYMKNSWRTKGLKTRDGHLLLFGKSARLKWEKLRKQ